MTQTPKKGLVFSWCCCLWCGATMRLWCGATMRLWCGATMRLVLWVLEKLQTDFLLLEELLLK